MRTLLLLSLALVACRPPAIETPRPPHIDSFAVSKTSTVAGETLTLSWRVSNATDLELREATLGTLEVPATQFEGSIEVKPTVNSVFVLTVRSRGGTDARALPVTVGAAPGPTSFVALPPVIGGGDVTTLVWTAPSARRVSLRAGSTELDTGGQLTAGAVTVRPLKDTTYALDVDGEVHEVRVTVQPAILEFTASARAIEVDGFITLSWRTAGATEVRLTGGIPVTSFVPDSGFSERLSTPGVVRYELVAEKGNERMTRTLEVLVGIDLAVTRLAMPGVAARGGTYGLRWDTIAADTIEVRVDGVNVFTTSTPSRVSSGSTSIPTPGDDFEVEFIAIDSRGPRVSRRTRVDVVGIPTSVTLSASPTTVNAGDAVTLSWSSPDSRHVRIVDGDGQPVFSVSGIAAENGSTTVHPPHDGTTYRIAADNLLGSTPVTASATVVVTGTPLDVVQSPRTAVSGGRLDVVANEPQAVLVGFPHHQVLEATRSEFVDISSTGQALDVVNSPGVAAVTPGFDTWLWGEKQAAQLVVSRAGWMAFGAPQVNVVNDVALPSSLAPRRLIAPFFDELRMTSSSSIWWQVVGDAPNERLIVQWSRLQLGTDASTELTFQAHVHQNGSVSFHYDTMRLPTLYTGFVIGLQDAFAQRAVTSDFVPVDDTALYFFSPLSSSAPLTAARRTTWGGFVQKNGVSALISRASKVVGLPEDLAVTEVMSRPRVTDGQYIELLNRTAAPLELSGWSLGGSFTFPSGFTLPVDTPVVVGASMNAAENDDAGVALAWSNFSLDGGAFFFGVNDAGVNIATSSDPGVARIIEPGITTCDAQTTYGNATPLQLGNPGVNAGCGFGYRAHAIAPNFVDVSDGGTALVVNATVDALTVPIALGSSPLPRVFGEQLAVVSMSVDGFLVPGSTTAINGENKTSAMNLAQPRGVIAPFWDDLQVAPGGGLFWKFIAAPEAHWIFQWHHVRHLNTQPGDDLNFEVKLFANGVIEYHYAEMRSGTFAGYGEGREATVWLERGDAGVALVESINAPLVRSRTALRFTPQ